MITDDEIMAAIQRLEEDGYDLHELFALFVRELTQAEEVYGPHVARQRGRALAERMAVDLGLDEPSTAAWFVVTGALVDKATVPDEN